MFSVFLLFLSFLNSHDDIENDDDASVSEQYVRIFMVGSVGYVEKEHEHDYVSTECGKLLTVVLEFYKFMGFHIKIPS